MDVHSLDGAVQHYFTSALAHSSYKTYTAAANKYLTFCRSFHLSPLPTSEATLCYFSACLGQQGLAHSTIQTYISGIRQLQIAHGLPEPKLDSMPRLRQVLRGVQLDHSKRGKTTHSRLPITPTILKRLKLVWIKDSERIPFNNIVLWAACLTTFFSFCRSGEITTEQENHFDPLLHLSYSDLAVDNPSDPAVISMLIKKSKCDQTGKGAKVYFGKTGDSLCPIAAMEAYLSIRGSNPDPLFLWESGVPLSKPSFVKHVKTALEQAGLPAKDYSGHSFRIGAATTAAVAGLEDSAIWTLGRWESSAFKRYIRLDPTYLASLSSTLAQCQL